MPPEGNEAGRLIEASGGQSAISDAMRMIREQERLRVLMDEFETYDPDEIRHRAMDNSCVTQGYRAEPLAFVGADPPTEQPTTTQSSPREDISPEEAVGINFWDSWTPPPDRFIHNYSYKPEPIMHSTTDEYPEYYFGLEIEAESDVHDLSSLAGRIVDGNSVVYCKRDSSIRNGFEMVTHPLSWGYVKEHIRENGVLCKMLDRASEFGMKSFKTKTCGMHIHVGQEAFAGTLHLYKFLRMIYNNKRFTKRMARRAGSRLDSWASLDTKYMSIDQMAEEKRSISRHVAVNLNNEHTFEVRIFRGTLNPDGVMRNICFVRSLIEYTRNAPLDEYSLKGYKEYVRHNAKEYIELVDKI
jgi:hypothetical protein